MNIEKINNESGESPENKSKVSVKSRLKKYAETPTKVIAIAIVAMFMCTTLGAATQVSYTIDAEKDLPKTFVFDFYQNVELEITNISKPSGIVLKIDTPVENTINFCGKSYQLTPLKTNVIVARAVGTASANFAAIAGLKLTVERTYSPVVITEDSKVQGETYETHEKHAHGRWYAAEFEISNLTSPPTNHVTVNLTDSTQDLYYLTITNGSISIFGLYKPEEQQYVNISIYNWTQIFRVMAKNSSANFTLDIDPSPT